MHGIDRVGCGQLAVSKSLLDPTQERYLTEGVYIEKYEVLCKSGMSFVQVEARRVSGTDQRASDKGHEYSLGD